MAQWHFIKICVFDTSSNSWGKMRLQSEPPKREKYKAAIVPAGAGVVLCRAFRFGIPFIFKKIKGRKSLSLKLDKS